MYEPQNEMYYNEPVVTQERIAAYLAKVMGWMCVGLFTTLVTAMLFATVEPLLYWLVTSNAFYFILIAQLVVVIAMSAMVRKISPAAATLFFMFYAALTGVTLSIFFLVYELVSLILVFGLTAGIFLCMSIYGFATKKDLTGMGSMLLFGLLGIIAAGLINMFMGNAMLDFLITCAGIVIFVGLTAYDTQRIKAIYIGTVEAGHDEESPAVRKLAIFGALTLYLDFINLFLKLVRLLGRRK